MEPDTTQIDDRELDQVDGWTPGVNSYYPGTSYHNLLFIVVICLFNMLVEPWDA